MNSKNAEFKDDPHPLTSYGVPLEQDALSIVEQEIKLDEARRLKVPGFSSSLQ